MKILLVRTSAGHISVTGVNSYNLQEIGLARALNQKGHKCDVVYFGGKESETVSIEYDDQGNTFNVFYLKARDVFHDSWYFGINQLAEQYDIIHSGGYDTIQSWRFAKKFPQKLVIYNGTYYSDFNKNYNKKCSVIDKIFVPRYKKYNITFDTKSKLSEDFLRQKGLMDVTSVGVGVDLSTIEYNADANNPFISQIHTLKDEGFRLMLYVGRIEPRRNIHFLFDVLKRINESDNKVKLVVIGNKGPAEYQDTVWEYAKDNNLMNYIVYQPFLDQKHLKYVYETCDVFLLPTFYDIFGMVLLEAMYYGMTVVSSNCGGACMLIENGISGYVIDNFDVDIWKKYITDVLGNPKKSKQIGQSAHKVISEQYTWDAIADKMLDIFERKLNVNPQ